MLFTDLAKFDNGYSGYFVMNAHDVHYYWHGGYDAFSQDVGWVSVGLVFAALVMMIPLVLQIKGKYAFWLLWFNVLISGTIIFTQFWGIEHAIDRIFIETRGLAEAEYMLSFYFSYYALGFSFLAALLYSFYGKRFRNISVEQNNKHL